MRRALLLGVGVLVVLGAVVGVVLAVRPSHHRRVRTTSSSVPVPATSTEKKK
jgi:hypothetical protein